MVVVMVWNIYMDDGYPNAVISANAEIHTI